jgi:flagellin
MKGKAVASADISLDTASRAALNADFIALRAQINTIVENASFNGTNLIDGSVSGITALASADGVNKITVLSEDMNLSGSIITMSTLGQISTQASASAMMTTLNESLQNVNAALARLGSGSKKFSIQNEFITKLIDTLNTGIGNLVDADLAIESPNTGLAGQAATGRSSALHCQSAATDHSLALPLDAVESGDSG